MSDNEQQSQDIAQRPAEHVPVLPLRDVVVYPHMVIPLFVGREKSIHALEAAMEADKQILLVAQKSADVDDPGQDDIYEVGTVATILQMLRLPDGTVKVLVEGSERATVTALFETDDHFAASHRAIEETGADDEREIGVLMRSVLSLCDQYVKLNKKVPSEVLTSLQSIEQPGRLADTIAAHLSLKLEEKQKILEIENVRDRLEHVMAVIEGEIDILQIEKRIRGRVKQQMEKSQREYYLNEQAKAIQKELGELEEGGGNEAEELARKIENAGMPKHVREKAENELAKLRMMSPMAAEASVVRNYIEALVNVPWKKKTRLKKDLERAKQVLDEDHYGLEQVKDRIIEYLAVQQRVKKLKGPILCLVGPPGVGKTSLGQSIARAVNRKFIRVSLGGVRDEAEIRGHRRTYIGSMPGKIIQNLSKVGVKNPVFMLDEVDKMSMDFRGDPASALLEVLDPEQNHQFSDHYLEVDFDLSDVMFITTANTLDIPPALMDRMEVIRLPGYTEDEKLAIAQRHLLPKQLRNNGLKEQELAITETALREIISRYTREAGVRNLEREIAKICRKVVKELMTQKEISAITVDEDKLQDYLGVPRYRYGLAEENDRIGQVTGLAWTEAGGELLTIESAVVQGTGKHSQTGQLGDVMKESVSAAMTVVRSRAAALGIADDFHNKYDFHIHVPEGAIPKDGPSAGVGMCTALISSLTGIPVSAQVAMTGEITLRGEVLPVGGLKEKLLAARRGGIHTVLVPEENRKDLTEIPEHITQDMDVQPVRWIDQVLELALQRMPAPREDAGDTQRQSQDSAESGKDPDAVRAH